MVCLCWGRVCGHSSRGTTDDRPSATESSKPSRKRRKNRLASNGPNLVHVVEPPDLLLVEVLEALPGRPISGERLVRPDGTISLGFYGDVEVAGLTIPEVKEKIVLHLKKYLSDEVLGLAENQIRRPESPDGQLEQPCKIDPKDTDRVFVDVTAYNSRNYYIEGEVATPGRLPFTGSERVLDAIHFAGGLLPSADQRKIKLIRSFPKGSPVQVLPIDYHEIAMGTDSSTNYEILPYRPHRRPA